MAEKTIIDYKQLCEIARIFEAEGEEITLLLMKIRKNVHDKQAE